MTRSSCDSGEGVRSIETALHDRDVVPAAELERGLALDADRPEALARVQAERRRVPAGDPRHDRMVLERPSPANQLGENQPAESDAAVITRDVDGILDRS